MMTENGKELKLVGGGEFFAVYNNLCCIDLPVDLPNTRRVLAGLCDLRVPLTFDEDDCRQVAAVITEALNQVVPK